MEIKREHLFEFLRDRGLIYQATDLENVKKILNSKTPVTFYLGIDPTASSLHIGHLCSLRTFSYLQKAGHHGILLLGGATGHIGDPTGRRDMRTMLSSDAIEGNVSAIMQTVKKFIKTDGDNPAIIVNNNDWMKNYSYIDFLRDVGTHFNVNVMLSTDACKTRLASGGLTFLEMGYSLVQAHDFEELYKKYGCTLEVGGSDQWANMVAGCDLIRKKYNKQVETLTTPLLLNSKGEKMGKTSGGAVWISEEKLSAYDFYQYFINTSDEDVKTLLRWFSDFSNEEIEKIMSGDIRQAKKIMAYEVTKLVHGEEKAKISEKTASELFSGNGNSENMESVSIKTAQKEINVCDLLLEARLVSSKGEARRLIEQNGISLDDKKVSDLNLMIKTDKDVVAKKGKKVYLKIKFN
ncbi:MAG: tyrosine--tRNA ligase [Clostridia bacterium]|nr:tyrosine--tRNA ligase [Clostridia bacterium]